MSEGIMLAQAGLDATLVPLGAAILIGLAFATCAISACKQRW